MRRLTVNATAHSLSGGIVSWGVLPISKWNVNENYAEKRPAKKHFLLPNLTMWETMFIKYVNILLSENYNHGLYNSLLMVFFSVNVSEIFTNPERIESSLSDLGINNTNFWSLAAPRIHAGYIAIKPVCIRILVQRNYSVHDLRYHIVFKSII